MRSRKFQKYDGLLDAANRWAGWTIKPAPLDGIKEVISPAKKLILFDESRDPCEATAHAVAHLDLRHHEDAGWMCEEQEAQADWLAQVRIDGERSWGQDEVERWRQEL